MQMWSDELEELRAPSRQIVDQGLAAIAAMFDTPGPAPKTLVEAIAVQRAAMARNFVPLDEAEVRMIAEVPCRVFRPAGAAAALYLHFHGGGMALGAPEMNDAASLGLTRSHDLAVVSVDYRLAPEHPFPAGPDDGLAVAAWLLEHAEAEFGSGRLIIGGESAGGYMAAAVLLRIRDELAAADRVRGANLVFGVYDWGRSPSQRGFGAFTGADMLTPDGLALFANAYLPERSDDERRYGSISPLFADLRGLCPALFSVGSGDHLLDDTIMMAPRWAAAGNDTELLVLPDMPHGFMAFPTPLTQVWAERTAAWLTRILA